MVSPNGSLKKERMEELWERHEADAACQRFWQKHSVSEKVECLIFESLELPRKVDAG